MMQMTPAQFKAWCAGRVDVTPDGCWQWRGSLDKGGYGRVGYNGRLRYPHRVAYELCTGPIPPDFDVDHLCRNRACCNPAHLEAVTHRENMLRGQTLAAANAAKTHCSRGHEYSPENTWTSKRGQRFCRKCRYINLKAYRKRHRR